MPAPSRRDFLKVGSLLSGAFAVSHLASPLASAASKPNVLIFVFDAMSAKNLSLYGYRRKTTPNLERFAQRATVFNQHYSPGSFTTPGTASLLTGLYPWTHRAINRAGLIARQLVHQNIFRALGKPYYRVAFSQNIWAHYFFGQFQGDIEKVLSPAAFGLAGQLVADYFGADKVDSHRAFDDFLFQDRNPPASLLFGLAERFDIQRTARAASAAPGSPTIASTTYYPIYFELKTVFDGLIATVEKLNSPSLAYLHLWTPHEPFQPNKDFAGRFADGWAPPSKPRSKNSEAPFISSEDALRRDRQAYDEYIANLDNEFGRLLDFLEVSGALDQSYVVVTSDHGEMFERGVEGHISRLLYDPVVRVPLLVSSPNQTSRRDVDIPTSAIDLLPTLAHLSGTEVPAWCEGQVLPGMGGDEDPQRSIYMMDAKRNAAFSALSYASFALRRGRYKLINYIGLRQHLRDGGLFELYDIENDPEELDDLYAAKTDIAKDLRVDLVARIQHANAQFKS